MTVEVGRRGWQGFRGCGRKSRVVEVSRAIAMMRGGTWHLLRWLQGCIHEWRLLALVGGSGLVDNNFSHIRGWFVSCGIWTFSTRRRRRSCARHFAGWTVAINPTTEEPELSILFDMVYKVYKFCCTVCDWTAPNGTKWQMKKNQKHIQSK